MVVVERVDVEWVVVESERLVVMEAQQLPVVEELEFEQQTVLFE